MIHNFCKSIRTKMFLSLMICLFNHDISAGQSSNVLLSIELKNHRLFYTMSNQSQEDFYFVDFMINQSYFFSIKIDSSECNVCDVVSPQIKLDYNYLRKKYKVKLRSGQSITKQIRFPKKEEYSIIPCDPARSIKLILVYSPGMFAPEFDSKNKINFISENIFSNPIELNKGDILNW